MQIPSRLQATPWKTAVLLQVMVCSLFVIIAPRAHASGTFVNPLNTSADPWMQYHNGYYYLATTQGNSIKIWKAASISGLLTASPTTVWTGCCNVWAAEFHLLNGPNGLRWYLYYTKDDGIDVNHRMYVLESSGTDPLGPYTDKGRIATDPNNQYYAIDGSVLRKSDGSLYFLWAGHPGHTTAARPARSASPGMPTGRRSYYLTIDRVDISASATDATRYEAEHAQLTNARVATIASASNGQKVGYIDSADSFVEFRVNVPNSGTYTLRTLYSNGWGSSSHNISVNGGAPFSQSYANNGVDVWTAATTTVNLNSGTNTIRFTKGAQFTELDYIEVYR